MKFTGQMKFLFLFWLLTIILKVQLQNHLVFKFSLELICFCNFPGVFIKSVFRTTEYLFILNLKKNEQNHMPSVYRTTMVGLILLVQLGSTLCMSYSNVE